MHDLGVFAVNESYLGSLHAELVELCSRKD
jgi:hypothetical protein